MPFGDTEGTAGWALTAIPSHKTNLTLYQNLVHCSGLGLPFAIGLGPETNQCVFVTDHKVDDFFKVHPPEHVSLKPRVLFLSEEPILGSLLSEKAMEQIR